MIRKEHLLNGNFPNVQHAYVFSKHVTIMMLFMKIATIVVCFVGRLVAICKDAKGHAKSMWWIQLQTYREQQNQTFPFKSTPKLVCTGASFLLYIPTVHFYCTFQVGCQENREKPETHYST